MDHGVCVSGMWSGRRVMSLFISQEPIVFSPFSYHSSSESYHLSLRPLESFLWVFSLHSNPFSTQQPEWPFKNAVLIMPLLNLNFFFGVTLPLGGSHNYHDFLSRLFMLWPQLTSAPHPTPLPPMLLCFSCSCTVQFLELTFHTGSHLGAFTPLHMLLSYWSSVYNFDFLNREESTIHYNLFSPTHIV